MIPTFFIRSSIVLWLGAWLAAVYPVAGHAQYTVTGYTTTADVVNGFLTQFVGAGVNVTNVTVTGDLQAFGTYNNSAVPGANRPNGLILSTGNAVTSSNLTGGNCASGNQTTNLGTPGDPDLTTAAGAASLDAAVITFTFVPSTNQVSLRYSFGSEEYPEFAPPNNNAFNDVFGFFVTGPDPLGGNYTSFNIARLPDNSVVSINNVNAITNAGLYIPNAGCGTIPNYTADGSTITLTTVLLDVVPCQAYQMKIAIADVGDRSYDSQVLLEAGSFGGAPIDPILADGVLGSNSTYEFCSNDLSIFFERDATSPNYDPNAPLNIPITFAGTATLGLDYTVSATSLVLAPGQLSTTVTIEPILDALNEGDETLFVIYTQPGACQPDTLRLTIREGFNGPTLGGLQPTYCVTSTTPIPLTLFPPDIGVVSGPGVTQTGPNQYFFTPSLAGVGSHTLTHARTAANCPYSVQLPVQVIAAPTLNVSPLTQTLCAPLSGTVTASASGGGGGPYQFGLTGPTYTVTGQASGTFNNLGVGTHTVSVTSAAGCVTTQNITINSSVQVSITAQTNVTCNGASTGSATAAASSGLPPYTFSWSVGGTAPTRTNLAAGTYTVTVTDAAGCTATAQVTISQPPALAIATARVNVTCNGANNGSINATVGGGVPPYTYQWSGSSTATTEDLTNLGPGSYTLTVRDANNCTASQSVTVTEPAVLTVQTNKVDVPCNGQTTGSITTTPAGGTAPYTYQWSGSSTATTQNLTNIGAGTYTITVRDANNCTVSATVTITQPATALSVSTAKTDILCHGQTTGSITTTPAGGTAPYTYQWSGSSTATTQNLTNIGAGTYTITVRDANNCTVSATVNVLQPNAITLNPSSTPIACAGGTSTLTVVGSGGTNPLVYSLNGGTQTLNPTFPGLTPATYTISVTDGNGCIASQTVTITEPAVLDLSATVVPANCSNTPVGSITTSVTGGTAPYSYLWTPGGQTTPNRTGLAIGTYTVRVTDANGCTAQLINNVTGNPAPTVTVAPPNATICLGNAADFTASGAQTYQWAPSTGIVGPADQATITVSPTTSTVYTVTGTDANGCTGTATATLTVNSGAQFDFVRNGSTIVTTPECFRLTPAQNNQVGTVWYGAPINLNQPFDYTFNLNFGTKDAAGADGIAFVLQNLGTTNQGAGGGGIGYLGMAAPNFAVEFDTYDNGPGAGDIPCDHTQIVLNGNAATNLGPAVQASAANCNIEDGINHTVRIVWDPATNNLQVFFDGVIRHNVTYNITNNIFGGNPEVYWGFTAATGGSNNNQSVCMPAVPPVVYGTPVANPATNVSCTTFQANWTNAAGAQEYILEVSTNPTFTPPLVGTFTTFNLNRNLTGLTSNTTYYYRVRARNACGFSPYSNVITVTTVSLNVTITAQTDVACFGGNTGSATALATGGLPPLTFSWSGGGNQPTKPNLTAGTYTVTVADAGSCVGTAVVTITQPPALTLVLDPADILCNGAATGAVDATPGGGVAPYTYQWSGASTATTEDLTGVPAGTYTLTVRDANSCTISQTVTLTQPPPLTLNTVPTNILCNGAATGAVDATPGGGVAPYTYQWSSGATTEDLTGLPAGTYTLTVTDANGCTISQTVTLTEPAALQGQTAVTDVGCFGSATGSIDLTVSGGLPAYSYQWSGNGVNATTQDLTNVGVGTYTVQITDANGCTLVLQATVGQPTSVQLQASAVPALCFGTATGSVSAVANGGTPPFTFAWFNGVNPVGTGAALTDLPAGTYTIQLTDANGCTISAQTTITQPDTLVAGGAFVNPTCSGFNNGSIDLTVNGGTIPYIYQWSSGATTQDLAGISAGSYDVTVTDANGCQVTAQFVLTEPNPLTASLIGQNISCFGLADGSLTLAVQGGTVPYAFQWADGPTTQNRTNLPAGTYSVIITDAQGCVVNLTETLSQPQPLTVAVSGTDALCFNTATATATAVPVGGTAPYAYFWSPGGQTTATATGLLAGSYTVTITDANGCTVSGGVTLGQPQLLQASAVSTPTCVNRLDGTIDLTVNGGTAPYNYLWTPGGATTEDLTGLANGIYNVVVTDANACQTATSVTVVGLSLPQPVITPVGPSEVCQGDTIRLSATPGFVSYQWSTGETTPTIFLTQTASPTVTVIDANGCEGTSPAFFALVRPLPSLNVLPSKVNLCQNDTALLIVTGAATYAWEPAELVFARSANGDTIVARPSVTTTFTVTGTDIFGCVNTTTQTLFVSIGLTADAGENLTAYPGTPTQLNGVASGGFGAKTYLWTPPTGLSCTTCPNPIALVTAPTTYTLTVTDELGCTATDDVNLIFIDVPPAPLQANAQVIQTAYLCYGQQLQLIGDGIGGWFPYTYKWEPSYGLNDSILKNPVASPEVIVVYTLTVTDAIGQTATDIVQLTPLPKATVSAGPDHVICLGSSVQLGGTPFTAYNGAAPYKYLWAPATGLSCTTCPKPVASPAAHTTYTLAVSDTNGCVFYDEVVVSVSAFPPVQVHTAAQVRYCGVGQGVALAATATSGNGQYSYLWEPALGLNTPTVPNPTAKPAVTTTYTVRVVDGNGCVAFDSQRVVVSAPMTLTIPQPPATICAGVPYHLNAAVASGGQPPFSYAWSPADGLISGINGPNPVAVLNQSQVYQLTVTDANGCTAHAIVGLTVTPLLSVDAGVNHTLCGGGTAVLQATVAGGSGNLAYAWTPVNGLSDPTALKPVAQPTQTTVYTLTVTDAAGCTATDRVTVYAGPAIDVSLKTGSVAVCAGSSAKPQVQVAGGLGTYTYSWTNAAGLEVSTDREPVFTPTANRTYYLTVTDPNGCSDTASYSVQVLPFGLTDVRLQAAVPEVLCAGDTVTATAFPFHAAGYTWYRNGQLIAGATGFSLPITVSGVYTVVLTDAKGCTGKAVDSVRVTFPPAPAAPSLTLANNVFTVVPANGVNYKWYRGSVLIAQTTEPTLPLAEPGIYHVRVQDEAGCWIASDTFTVFALSREQDSFAAAITVYPNPGSTTLAITGLTPGTEVAVFDVVGKTLLTRVATTSTLDLSATAWSAGVYTVRFRHGAQQHTLKWTKTSH